jgi:predicted nucleic acid-binding protein
MGLILDSSVVIDSERRGETVEQLIERAIRAAQDQDAALSAVGLTEIVHGVFRANTLERRTRRESFLQDLLASLTVYPYATETALLAGRIDSEERAKGVIVPFNDLLIGATALQLGFSLLTANARHFRLIPRLTVIQI